MNKEKRKIRRVNGYKKSRRQLKKARSVEVLGNQIFYNDALLCFELSTESVKEENQKLLEEGIFTTKAIAQVNEPNVHAKALEIMKAGGLIDASSIRLFAIFIIKRKK